MKEYDTKLKGNITELETAVALIRRNCGVCMPYGDRNRYDLVADIDGKFVRIQCKTSRTTDGGKTFKFSTRSSCVKDGRRGHKKYSPDEVDYLATVFNNKCYLVPVTDDLTIDKTLRVVETNNSQSKNINWAKDFTVDVVLSRIRGKIEREKHMKEKLSGETIVKEAAEHAA